MNIDFTWWRDRKGYRHFPKEPPPPFKPEPNPLFGGRFLTHPSLLGESGKPERIIRRGGGKDLVAYRPFEHNNSIYRVFAAVTSAQNAFTFIPLYGPLPAAALDHK